MSQYDGFGQNRVLEPQYVLPTSAWKLDNSRKIEPFEMRVDIHREPALNRFVLKQMTTMSE